MSKKKSGKKRHQPVRPSIMLSQCMIVKNEEKNIERALRWAENIAYEQIVVDTGSTDNTVEIAERMGAQVYHFEWNDDFSAAKNFAIEKATGNWIAFLDADEYFLPEDTKKFMIFLQRIQADPQMRKNYLAMGCQFIDLDENGNKISSGVQLRAFRNIPSIRYTGRIHERLDMNKDNIVLVDEIKIIHTGYGKKKMKEKGKSERNIKMLRQELSENPDDLNTKAYLADSLKNSDNEEDRREAESLYTEVVSSGVYGLVHYALKHKAYLYLMRRYIDRPEMADKCRQICEQGLEEFPDQLDFMYYLAYVKNNSGEHQSAWELLKTCEDKLGSKLDVTETYNIALDPTMLYSQLVIAAQGLGDTDNTIGYVTLILKADKTRPRLLHPYIRRLLEIGKTTEEVIIQLKSIYDFKNPDDLMYMANTANECGAFKLAEKVMKS